MVCLNCYTLTGECISGGIDAGSFDCIIPAGEGAGGLVRTAYMQAMPVLPERKVRLTRLAPLCVNFVHEAEGDAEPGAGILLSVDPSEWIPATDSPSRLVLVAPGPGGRLLLYVGSGVKCALAAADGSGMAFGNSADDTPSIGRVPRARMLLDALQPPSTTSARRR